MTDHESSDEVIRRNRLAVQKSQDDYHKRKQQAAEQSARELAEEESDPTPVLASEGHSSGSPPTHVVDLEPDPEIEDDLSSVHSGSHASSRSEIISFAGGRTSLLTPEQSFRQLEEQQNVPDSIRARNRHREAMAQRRRDQERGLAPVEEDTVATHGPPRGADPVSPTAEGSFRPDRRSASVCSDVRLQHGASIPSGSDAPRTGHRQHPSRQQPPPLQRQRGQIVRAPEPDAERPPRSWDYEERGDSTLTRLSNEANARTIVENREAAIRAIEHQVVLDAREEEDRVSGRHRGESQWDWENRRERDARNTTFDWNEEPSVAIARARPTQPAQSWQN